MAESSYRATVDEQRIQHIRQITKELPASCADFMRGIAMTTSTFTRLAYALDLRTCFFITCVTSGSPFRKSR